MFLSEAVLKARGTPSPRDRLKSGVGMHGRVSLTMGAHVDRLVPA